MQRRLPKRGFTNIFRKEYVLINVRDLNRFDDGAVVTLEALRERGLVKKKQIDGVKILGDGELERRVVVHAHKFSASAMRKITERGGTVVEM